MVSRCGTASDVVLAQRRTLSAAVAVVAAAVRDSEGGLADFRASMVKTARHRFQWSTVAGQWKAAFDEHTLSLS